MFVIELTLSGKRSTGQELLIWQLGRWDSRTIHSIIPDDNYIGDCFRVVGALVMCHFQEVLRKLRAAGWLLFIVRLALVWARCFSLLSLLMHIIYANSLSLI
ncbi:unnamed protein product [Hapterophycus canaliculatus]